jgi:hypothetical protein
MIRSLSAMTSSVMEGKKHSGSSQYLSFAVVIVAGKE